MDIKNLQLNDLLLENEEQCVTAVKHQQQQSLAIVGMAGQIAEAENLEAFWSLLSQGNTSVGECPAQRKQDCEAFLNLASGATQQSADYVKEGYLPRIDLFDYRFFGLSRQEARLMDPQQRLFLQTAWQALENAGYAGQSIHGSKTAIYAGLSHDFGESYRRLIATHAPDAPEIAITGNINSVIAGRLAYLLDLKGPTMVVDTACSSSLVAVHLACQALLNGEADMALVGTVNVNVLPVLQTEHSDVGIKDIVDNLATDNQTKTFAHNSDGMSVGEGVMAIVIKPLDQAEADGDTIHAVIRGSAVNQDGRSMGLTAPSSQAQTDLIQQCWQNAQVKATDISYMEAHGTGTKLGDPIEIKGMNQAFASQTRKRQFCAVGSVKTNIGHLDNAAGLAGLIKVALAMKHQQLPASLHFHQPNGQIAFEQSAVYVNDRNTKWPHSQNNPVFAGVSAYGLSGTNCHVVLQSASSPVNDNSLSHSHPFIFVMSAADEQALQQLANAYVEWTNTESASSETVISIADVCFTAATGRLHHKYRFAAVIDSVGELQQQLTLFLKDKPGQYVCTDKSSMTEDHFAQMGGSGLADFFTHQKAAAAHQSLASEATSILDSAINRTSIQSLQKLAAYFCEGAHIDWSQLFATDMADNRCRRIPLPGYPLTQERCWIETSAAGKALAASRNMRQSSENHPLLHQVLRSQNMALYQAQLSASTHWELAEHKVQGACILPGTCYIEMICAALKDLLSGPGALPLFAESNLSLLQFDSVQFLTPFSVSQDQQKMLVIECVFKQSTLEVKALSQEPESGEWAVHAEVVISSQQPNAAELNNAQNEPVEQIQKRLMQPVPFTQQDDLERGLDIGARWHQNFIQGVMDEERSEFLIELALPDRYVHELSDYTCHPALLDTAVNAANHLVGDGALYLPLFYRALQIIKPLPGHCWVHLIRLGDADSEVVQFKVNLLDNTGQLCAQVSEYGIKKVTQNLIVQSPSLVEHTYTLAMDALPAEIHSDKALAVSSMRTVEQVPAVLFIRDNESHYGTKQLAEALEVEGAALTLLNIGLSSWTEQLEKLVDENREFSDIVYAAAWHATDVNAEAVSINQLMSTIQSLSTHKLLPGSGRFTVLTHGAFGEDSQPLQAAIASFSRVAELENPQLQVECIDSQFDHTEQLARLILMPSTRPNNLAEANHSRPAVFHLTSDGAFQQQSLTKVKVPETGQVLQWTEGAVYLITGGLGALGSALALEFAHQAARSQCKITLALTGFNSLPAQETWSALITDPSISAKLKHQIETLMAIEALGVRVCSYALDVANTGQLEQCLQELRAHHGPIKGVVHAAGRAGAGFIVNKTPEQLQQVLNAKVQGGWNLHLLTQSDELDFFVSYSSMASVCHEAGQSDYTAANRFLDGLSLLRRQCGLPALSVCWPAWSEIGIAVEYQAVNNDDWFLPVATEQAINWLMDILPIHAQLPAVLIPGQLNLSKSAEQYQALNIQLSDDIQNQLSRKAASDSASGSDSQVEIIGLSDPDQYDKQVAEVWGKVLGINSLNVDDNFSDLGGNSILTTQVYREYETLHPGVVDMADLFTHSRLSEQSGLLRNTLQPKPSSEQAGFEDQLEQQLAKLAAGEISVDDMQSFI